MTDNQKRFAREYVKCGNATEAYKKVYKVKNDMSAGTLRITFGKDNTKGDVDYLINCLQEMMNETHN